MSGRRAKEQAKFFGARETLALLRLGYYNVQRPDQMILEDVLSVLKFFDTRIKRLERKS